MIKKIKNSIKNNNKILLILLLGLSIRLINLNQSFWLDEAAQVIESSRSLSQQFDIIADFHPPLYHLFLHFWIIFGKSEIWVRLPSVLFGVGCIYFIFEIAKNIGYKKAGYLAALLLAISPYHIWYSQEARPYMLFAFLSLVATNYLLKNNWKLYAISLVLCLYSLYFAPFLILGHFVYIITFDRKKIRQFIFACLFSALLFIPWVTYFIKQIQVGTNGLFAGWTDVVSVPVLKAIPLTFAKFILGKGSIDNNYLYAFVLIPFFAVFLSGCYMARKNKPGKTTLLFFFVPFLSAVITSIFIKIVAPQRLIFLLPFFYLITSIGVLSYSKLWIKISFIIVIITSISGCIWYMTSPNIQREQWRESISYINSESTVDNIVLFVFPDPFAPYLWYGNNSIDAVGIAPKFQIQKQDLVDLSPELSDKKRVFLYQYLTGLTDPQNETQKYLEDQGYYQGRIQNFPGVGFVYLYEKK